ncbi:hypothetical protein [Streptomyces noursei]|uniref:hypothetical protein n=1 Tax=Streptomyces noursei TaxID=1971 RepID=UPI0030EFC432
MARYSTVEFPYDSSHFTSLQLHPVAAVRIMLAGWTAWTAQHAVAFPTMIREHHAGFAVTGIRLAYQEPFGFLDGERLTATTTSSLLRQRNLMETTTHISADGRQLAVVTMRCRALAVDVARAMAATPQALPPSVTGHYQPDEIDDQAAFTDELTPLLDRLAATAPALVQASYTRLIDRQVCEAADQWCFVDVTGLIGSSREHLIDTLADTQPLLREGLRRRISHLEFRLRRPLFLHDRTTIDTSLHQDGTRFAFAHRISGDDGHLHGEAVEILDAQP